MEGTQFGIIVLTSDNLTAPWILFEAGALSKAFTASHVCPFLIDLDFKDISGPLSQFQAKKSDRASTLELLQAINSEATTPVEVGHLSELFDALWPKLEARLRTIPPLKGSETRSRSQAQILEELVIATRRMEARIEAFGAERSVEAPTARPPTREPTIDVLLNRQVPRFEDAEAISFEVHKDIVSEIAAICELEKDDYGKSWRLKRPKTGRIISRRDGAVYARRARHVAQTFELELSPEGNFEMPSPN